MAKVIRLKDFQVSPSDSFIFDNSVWVNIYAPMAGHNLYKQSAYSKLLSDIISRKATIYLTSLVLSEFVNFNLRTAFKRWQQNESRHFANYKMDFMPTAEFQTAFSAVKSSVYDIEKVSTKRPDDFNTLAMSDILNVAENIDFNDSYFVNYCIKNNIKLVTDDGDFQKVADDRLIVLTI